MAAFIVLAWAAVGVCCRMALASTIRRRHWLWLEPAQRQRSLTGSLSLRNDHITRRIELIINSLCAALFVLLFYFIAMFC